MSDNTEAIERLEARCCIAGGGPAGIMLGFLLARAGISVVVLEKHADFFRDFRGDTIHPSTLELMRELGLLDDFLKLPHQKVPELTGQVGGTEVTVADFSHVPTTCKFIALMPQWDFLNFIAERARRYSHFQLRMGSEAVDLVRSGDRVIGVRTREAGSVVEIRADLVIGADGRHSTVRREAGLETLDIGAPIDVLWMRIPKHADDPEQSIGRFDAGRIFITINRSDYWQCAFVIAKGTYDEIRAKGLLAFRDEIARLTPFMRGRLDALRAWSDISLLTVTVDRLRQWCAPGLLCIGDAAHAMSPIGGVGINLAIQDAVAAANILCAPLANGAPSIADLRAVQRRREWPTRLTQRLKVSVQNRVFSRVLGSTRSIAPPWPLLALRRFPILRRIPARLVGIGFRPEHVRTPERPPR